MTATLASSLFTEIGLTDLLTAALLAATPLLLASLGELVSEQAGVLNLGLEGMMLAGAYSGFLVAYETGSSWLGFLAGAAAGVLTSLIVVALCVRWLLDQIVVGIGITLSIGGLTSVLHGAQFGTSYPRLDAAPTVSIPLLDRIPVLGPALFTQSLLVYLALAAVVLAALALRRTSRGLALRAAGLKPETVDAAGVDVAHVRTIGVVAAGLGAGLGGAYLAIAVSGVFVPFLTQGQGFIAIVICMLARGRPALALTGAFVFGLSLSLQTSLQLHGVEISNDLVDMLPFVAVLVALVLFGRRDQLPPALGRPFRRGAGDHS